MNIITEQTNTEKKKKEDIHFFPRGRRGIAAEGCFSVIPSIFVFPLADSLLLLF